MHRNAPLTPEGRRRLCRLIEDGWTVASAAESMRISRQTAHKWWRRTRRPAKPGLMDRSSRPRRCPTKTPAQVERRWSSCDGAIRSSAARLARARRGPGLDAAPDLGTKRGPRLSDLERRSGRVIRRIETSHPGELVHIDMKKQAKIPPGGGWQVNGMHGRRPQRPGAGVHVWVTPSSTRPSTPTAGWPIQRSTPTSRP